MSHHTHEHAHHSTEITTAFFINLGFTILEIFGGLWTNSLAILSDAVHDLGDSFSLGIAWYLERFSHKEEDSTFTYGYRRFSLLSALLNAIVLLGGSLYILAEAIPRLLNPQHSNAQGMALLAVIGVGVNGFAALRLRQGKTMNTRVLTWHLLEDVLGWGAVLVVSLVMLVSDIHILDPLLSIAITLYVFYNVFRNLRKTMQLFLQAVPDQVDLDTITHQVEALPGVQSTHHLHAWSLEGENHVLTMHVMVDENAERNQVKELRREIRELLKDKALQHTTIEIEYGPHDCMMD